MSRFLIWATVLLASAGVLLAQHPNEARGFAADRVFDVHNVDTVNAFNGNMIIRIPIGPEYKVNGQLSYQLALTYNSHLWKFVDNFYTSCANGSGQPCSDDRGDATVTVQEMDAEPPWTDNAGLGWRLSLGRLYDQGDPDTFIDNAFWVYQSSDGADHEFFDTPLTDDTSPTVSPQYTRDNSRLRLTLIDSTTAHVEFPDGTVNTFRQLRRVPNGQWPFYQKSHEWFLTSISDTSGNTVFVDYSSTPTYKEIWTITDGARTTTAYFIDGLTRDFDCTLHHVDFQAVTGTSMSYTFAYRPDLDVATPSGDTSPRPKLTVPVLTAVTPPVGNPYSMIFGGVLAYESGLANHDTSGVLEHLVLPTLGSIGWTYETIPFGPIRAASFRHVGLDIAINDVRAPSIEIPTGVTKRTTYDEKGNPLGEWKYFRKHSKAEMCDTPPGCPITSPCTGSSGRPRQMTVFITDPPADDGVQKTTINYFSNYEYMDDPNGDTCDSAGWVSAEHGLPFTRYAPESLVHPNAKDNRFLSSEVRTGFTMDVNAWSGGKGQVPDDTQLAGAGTRLRETYVSYRLDPFTDPLVNDLYKFDHNNSLSSTVTYYLDDNQCGAAASELCFSATNNLGFDAYGHFRQTSTDGNLPGTGNYRTTFTNYNAAPTSSSLWLLTPFTEQCTVDEASLRSGDIAANGGGCGTLIGALTSRTQFDPSGHLTARRTLVKPDDSLSAGDLLAMFDYDHGNLKTEQYYGGDMQALDAGTQFAPPTTPAPYTVSHALKFQNTVPRPDGSPAQGGGALVRDTATYSNGVTVSDVVYDQATGAVTDVYDISGLVTHYDYDLLGRVTNVKPPGLAPTTYTYYDASSGSAFTPARVVAESSDATLGSVKKEYQYDAFGRLFAQTSLLPDDRWNIVQTYFDVLGRKCAVSMPELLTGSVSSLAPANRTKCLPEAAELPVNSFVPVHTTKYHYDAFDHVTESDAPDGNATNVAFLGIRSVKRTVNVATTSTGSTPSTTEEIHDAVGRLYQVAERSGPTSLLAPSGDLVITTYKYDSGDHLTEVSTPPLVGAPPQLREFKYDNRGFLVSEQHPEVGTNGNGVIQYVYDVPIGNTTRKIGYDARGHAHGKLTGLANGTLDLRYNYDSSERITAVTDSGDSTRPLKEYFYWPDNDTSTDPARPNLGRGKLRQAVRHNHPGGFPGEVTVTETYTYASPPPPAPPALSGRISKRDTLIESVNGSARTTLQEFAQYATYDQLGSIAQIDYPTCMVTCSNPPSGTPPAYTRKNGFLTGVTGYAAPITYNADGSIFEITHAAPDVKDTYTPDSSGMGRPGVISFSGVAACAKPAPVISAPDTLCADTTGYSASVAPVDGETYAWTIEGGTITAGATTASVTFAAGHDRTLTLTLQASNACGPAPAPARRAFVLDPTPTIATQPVSASATIPIAGEGSVTATVLAGGTMQYTWFASPKGDTSVPVLFNGAPLSASGNTVTLRSSTSSTFVVWARITSCGGSVDSDAVTLSLTACTLPQVIVAGSGLILTPGERTTLTAYVDPPDPLATYQWYRGSDNAPMITGPTFDATTSSYDTYYCVVKVHCIGLTGKNDPTYTITSANAYLWVYGLCELPPLNIAQSVADVPAGSTDGVTFTAILDLPDVIFDWYKGQSGDTSHPVNADAGAPKRITVGTGDTGPAPYWVRARLTCGAFRDSETLTFTKNHCSPIIFSPQPQSVDIKSGTSTSLSADTPFAAQPIGTYNWFTVTGSKPSDLADTWLRDESGKKTLTVSPKTTTRYYVNVKSACSDQTISAVATVRVASCDLITVGLWPQDRSIPSGSGTSLVVSASSATSLTYQWYAGEVGDETNKLGTGATLSIPPLTDSATYWVRVDNGTCSADSPTVHVNVCKGVQATATYPATELTVQRFQVTPIWFHVTGTNVSYQWFEGTWPDGHPIARSADTVEVRPYDTTTYWVTATSHCSDGTSSSIASPNIRVSVCPQITAQPVSALDAVMPGLTTTLTAQGGLASATFQWYVGDSGDTSNPFGAHALTVTTPPITADTKFWLRITSGTCTTGSNSVTVHLCALNDVLWNIGSQSVAPGASATIRISPPQDGTSIDWYQGVSGDVAHSTLLLGPIPNMQYYQVGPVNQTSTFWARVRKDGCWKDSTTATISVCLPVISHSPDSILINAGASTTLSVVAAPATVTYQWYTGAAGDLSHPIAGATASSYLASPSATTSYWVRVDGGCGTTVDSAAATVTICQPPAILSVSPAQSLARGQSAVCQVNATGTNLTYQWYAGATGITTSPISGATANTVTVTPQDTTSYWVRVSGACGSKDSATMTVSVCMNPAISTPPQSGYIFSGTTATLTVAATEATSSPVTYQWFRGNAGDTTTSVGTGPSYTTPPLTVQTNYWARATCGVCSPADSPAATISICPIPATLPSPGNVNVAVGQTGHLSTISGAGNTYQWYTGASGNTSVPAPSTSYTLDIAPSVTTSYWCRVQNGTCATNTASGTVNVCIPTFTQLPQSTTITAGSSATLISAANTAGVTYQWYVGATGTTASPVTGSTAANLTVTPSSTTSYWVRATGTCGSVADSPAATVTICQPAALTNPPHDWCCAYGSGNASFSVTATGSNLTYQWYIGDSGVTTQPAGNGASTLMLPISATTKVWVRVIGQCGVAKDSAAVWASVSPSYVQQTPSSLTVGYNSTASMSVSAQGAYLHYVWKWGNGSLVAGAADSATLITPSITADSSIYCEVWSGIAETNSPGTTLSVCSDQLYINSLTKAASGSCQVVTISTSNGWPYDYQWYQGVRGDVSHQVAGGYASINVCPNVATQYWCRAIKTTPDGYAGCYIDSNAITVP